MGRVPFEMMCEVVREAFIKAGMNETDASICARIHSESSCDGIYSHGLNRVARFIDYIHRGWVDLKGKPAIQKNFGAVEIYDGNCGTGILNALFSMDRAMDIASKHGIGLVGLRNTTHWMRGGTYGWYAADKGYIAVCWTNTESCMPAWGGKNTRLGNNPFVMAVPRKDGHIVLDMAMSQYSYGKLQDIRLKDGKLPFPGGFDKNGNLTSEPGPIEESMRILPTGYWKGSGFAVLLDTFAALLSEGLATNGIDKIQHGSCTGCSQIFIAIDPRKFGGEEFSNNIADSVVDYVKTSSLAENNTEVTYPGELALRTRQDHLKNGVIVDDGIWADVLALTGGKHDHASGL
jgi:3-dehydro-L-gulonate 2-dehydrogenase